VSGPETTPFQDLNQGLQRLRDEELEALPASSMGEDITALLRHINGCQAEVMRRIVRFDDGVGYAGTGTFGTKSWLNWKGNLSYAAASHQLEVARQLAALPETTKAFADGEISYTHASMIARTAGTLGDKMESNAEMILVTDAKELDPYRLRIACMKLRHCMDPGGVLEDANGATELRFLHLSQTLDGVFYLNGRLDAEGGATLQTALNAVSGPPAADDRRSPKQRRADAAVELARRQLDQGDLPEVGGQRPHLSVIVEAATLAKQPGSPAAELEWAQAIPAETARRLACDAAITPILRGAESNQPQAGQTTRSISGSQRKALVARDRGCRFQGCDRPPDWTDAHHIHHWADGGKHVMPNLVLLCRRHHRMVHEEGWRLAWNDQGELVAVPP
jgi:predicted secreted protein